MAKQKIHSTTQDFTEIIDIKEEVVFLKGKNACTILEVSSVNFFLLSQDEQNARIYGYMSLLNSLSFAIQIIIVSKRIDLSFYLKLLDQKINNTQNQKILDHLKMYKDFIQELIKGEGLLDKKIYIIIPFSYLELGPTAGRTQVTQKQAVDFTTRAREILASKRSNVMTQVERIGLMSRVLQGEELAKLLYELFNEEAVTLNFDSNDVKNIIL